MSAPFVASRADGRSDRRIIYELAAVAEPETVFVYAALTGALAEGLEEEPSRLRIYRAVAAANKTLLREHRRYLAVVSNLGYRVIRTDEHLPVALAKKDMAQTYLSKGIELLRHADLNELTEVQRVLHEGQLMVLAGVYQAVQSSERRHAKQEEAIEELRRRVGTLETPQGGEP